MSDLGRRRFLRSTILGMAAAFSPVWAQGVRLVLGQGKFRYRVVPDWGVLGADTPVKDCHGLARDREGHLILLTNHPANNVIVFDRRGRLVHKWGTQFPGAHGLSIDPRGQPGSALHHVPRHSPGMRQRGSYRESRQWRPERTDLRFSALIGEMEERCDAGRGSKLAAYLSQFSV